MVANVTADSSKTRLTELSVTCKTRYAKISDFFKKKESLELSLAEEIRRLAADIEEIMILKGQKEFINTICSTIIRAFKDNKQYKLTKNQEHYIWEVLKPLGKYTVENCYSRSLGIPGNLPEENTIQFNHVLEAHRILKSVAQKPNNFTREQLTKLASLTFEHKDEVADMCKNYKIAVFDSDVTQSSLWESSDDADKYTQAIHTPKPDAFHNKIEQFWYEFGDMCYEIAKNCYEFPPQIMARENEIAEALNTYKEFFVPGKDMKFKRHWGDWFGITEKWDETSINNAANKSPAFACICPKCMEPDFLQDPTGSLGLKRNVMMHVEQLPPDDDDRIRWQWRCPQCGGTELAVRTMTRERVGDMIQVVLDYAMRIIKDMPMVCEFMDWFNEWRLPYITAQTLNLSPKLEEKC